MTEHDALILSHSHLRDFPRATDALQLLRRAASLVKPLMRARRWKVRELSEFYPDQPNLLGLNINRGQKILLRLRYPGDASLFLPLEQIADTLLHELAHIVRGPHDATFHALWNQLRDEHMALALKGYTGEGFLSEGRRLGGSTSSRPPSGSPSGSPSGQHPVPMAEARRLAKAAAERRRLAAEQDKSTGRHGAAAPGGGRRLGGSGPGSGKPLPPPHSSSLRRIVADAVARRNSHTPETMGGCATDGPQYNDQTRAVLEEQASRNGFRTQADEDAANEAAIAQALWELVQEDEKRRLGDRYLPPTAERPEGNGGWLTAQGSGLSPIIIDGDDDDNTSNDIMDIDPPPHPPPSRTRPVSMPPSAVPSRRPVSMAPPPPPPPRPSSSRHSRSSSSSVPPPGSSSSRSHGWTCNVCTLHNPTTFLCCDACGSERTFADIPSKETSSAPPIPHSSRPTPSQSLPSRPASSHPASSRPSPSLPSVLRRPPPPPPPPPKRSSAQSNAATAAAARTSQPSQSSQAVQSPQPQSHHHHRQQPKTKKKVTFTPSTRGGSISTATSTSARARPLTSPPGNRPPSTSSTNGASSIENGPLRQNGSAATSNYVSASSSATLASDTWMCTNCWRNMVRHSAACDICEKPKERWQ